MNDSWLKLTRAEHALEQLRSECLRSGKKMAVSQLAKMSGADRKYFYGHLNTPNAELRLRWKRLSDEVKKFNQSLLSSAQAAEVDQLSIKDKLRNALIENYSLVESAGRLNLIKKRLEDHLTQVREKNEALEHRIQLLEARLHETPVMNRPVVPFLHNPVVVSPDSLALGGDSLSRTKAWVKAVSELKILLARPLDKNLYITIGIPGSGKTTWTSAVQPSQRLSLIFDACSLTKSDRYEVLEAAKHLNNVRCIAVVFIVPLETALNRNRQRLESSRVPEEKIIDMYAYIEYPESFDIVVLFDEIILVRS